MAQKRALVCGASQGIGRATAIELAKGGTAVTLFSRSPEKLKSVLKDLKGEGHDYLAADISDVASWSKELSQKHRQKNYDIVILNSGGPKGGAISKAKPEEFIKAMTDHLVGSSQMVALFLEEMKKNRFGRIITITSTSVRMPIPHLGVSNTARAAVASWGKTLSFEVASFGITVNNVMPGYTQTPRLEFLIQAKAELNQKSYQEEEKSWIEQVPMKRFAQPEETAALIGFLTSDQASYITGQSIAVDGGRLGCL